MKLIVEALEPSESCLKTTIFERLDEGTNEPKKVYKFQGKFMQSEVKNRNGRIYPKKILNEAVDKLIREKVSTRRAYGSLDHPKEPTVNIQNSSHIITKLFFEGNDVFGEAELLPEEYPTANMIRALIREGITFGVSSRGIGDTYKKEGKDYIKTFHLFTVDVVADPSAPDCFVSGILENKEWVWNNHGVLIESKLYDLKNEISSKIIDEKEALKKYEQYLTNLTGVYSNAKR